MSDDAVELPSDGHTAVVHRGRIVVYGGMRESKGKSGDVWVLEPRTGALDYIVPQGDVPRGRHYHTAHVFEDQMYVVHGLSGTQSSAPELLMPVLNLSTFVWSSVRTTGDFPPVLFNHASVLVDNVIYIIGGYDEHSIDHASALYSLNLDDLTWRHIAATNAPDPLWGHVLCASGTDLIMHGGVNMNDDKESSAVWVFSLREKTWTKHDAATSSSASSQGQRTAAIANYAFEPTNTQRQLRLRVGDLIDITATGEVSNGVKGWLKGIIRGRAEEGEGWFPENHVRILSSGPAPYQRTFHSAAMTDANKLCIWGGEEEKARKFDDAWTYNIQKRRWKEVAKNGLRPPASNGQPMVWHSGVGYIPMLQRRELWQLDTSRGWTKLAIREMYSGSGNLRGSPAYGADPMTPTSVVPAHHPPPSPSQSSSVQNLSQILYGQAEREREHSNAHSPQVTASPGQLSSHTTYPHLTQQTSSPQRNHSNTTVNGVTITPASGGNVINIDRSASSHRGDAPVVVYVMGGGGGGSVGVPQSQMLSYGQHHPSTYSEHSPQVAPYAAAGSAAGLASVPSEPLREPAKFRVSSRQRTSSPHGHIPTTQRASNVPHEDDRITDIPIGSPARRPQSEAREEKVASPQARSPTPPPAPAATTASGRAASPQQTSLSSRPAAPLSQPAGAGARARGASMATGVREGSTATTPLVSAAGTAGTAGTQRDRAGSSSPQMRQESLHGGGVGVGGGGGGGSGGVGGPLTATPSVLTQCPAQAATPPRPLIPVQGRPHSPPRSTPSTHGLYDLSLVWHSFGDGK